MKVSSTLLKHHRNFSLLLDFTCATAKDELEKHPEMRTIAMAELENNFPPEFSREVLKCLPEDVAKIIIKPEWYFDLRKSLNLPKSTLTIYIADNIEWTMKGRSRSGCHCSQGSFIGILPKVHRSRQLIVSSDARNISVIIKKFPNVVQILEENQKVIARSFDMTRNLTTFEIFESSQRENLSQILFPDKAKNFNGKQISAVWMEEYDTLPFNGSNRPLNKWTFFLDIASEKLNATLNFTQLTRKTENMDDFLDDQRKQLVELDDKFDFFLNNFDNDWHELNSYNSIPYFFLAPLPKPYSITELILFLPLDKSCWMWLGITIAVSTLVWRISEGHWNFPFGYFAYFMGQGQLIIRIRTNRLTMKILLQLLIFAIFIFSNGYQSLVTSFMLDPEKRKLLKTIDEVLESDMKIVLDINFERLYIKDPRYQKALSDDRIDEEFNFLANDWAEKMVNKTMAMAQECQASRIKIEYEGDGKSFRGLYLIPKIIYYYHSDLFIRHFHPFLDKFQELMDRSFEAGLHQAWERLFWDTWIFIFAEKGEHKEETETLDFELIIPSFYILAIGFGAAILAFLSEIFCKDFVSQLSREYFKRKWNEICGQKIRRNRAHNRRKQVIARKIEVKPKRKSI